MLEPGNARLRQCNINIAIFDAVVGYNDATFVADFPNIVICIVDDERAIIVKTFE